MRVYIVLLQCVLLHHTNKDMYCVFCVVVMAAHTSAVHQPIPAQETVMPWWPVLDCPARISNLCSSTPQVSFFLSYAWKSPLEYLDATASLWLWQYLTVIYYSEIILFLCRVYMCLLDQLCYKYPALPLMPSATLWLVLNDMTSDVISLRNLWSRMPDHRGLPWRGRNLDQQWRREVHGTLRTQCQRFGLSGRGLAVHDHWDQGRKV